VGESQILHVPAGNPPSVLVIHHERETAHKLAQQVIEAGFEAYLCPDFPVTGSLPQHQAFPLILVALPGNGAADGHFDVQFIRHLSRASPASQIVLLLPAGIPLATCCEAVSLDVAGILEADGAPPFAGLPDRLRQAWNRYLAFQSEGQAAEGRRIFDETGFAGQSRAMAELLMQAKRIAAVSDVPVLIEGESGTGKQLLAEAIHRLDPKRSRHAFLSINCAAISGTLAESALFGHKRGAFTGATEERLGHFRAADGGTLLLDEVGELSAELQPKLLRVLQENAVLPVGSDREVPVDVRVAAATNRALEGAVARGEFRLDLFQRLNVVRLRLPPLRERPEDIPLLFHFFLRKYRAYYPQGVVDVDPRVYEVVARSVGSGNVREIENLVRRILAFKQHGERIELGDLPKQVLNVSPTRTGGGPDLHPFVAQAVAELLRCGVVPLQQITDQVERLILAEVLKLRDRTHAEMARMLGFTRRTFYNKLRKHRLGGPGGRSRLDPESRSLAGL